MAKQKIDPEGVPVRLDAAPDPRADGVAVVVPEDVPPATSSGAKSGQTASTRKEG